MSQNSTIHNAAQSGDIGVVQAYAASGKNLDIQNDDLRTPLHAAAAHGQLDTVRLLIEKGADPHAMDKYGEIPAYLAAVEGRVEVLDIFLEKGINPDVRNKADFTILHFLTRHAAEHKVTRLIGYRNDQKVVIRNPETINAYLKRDDPYGGMFKRYLEIAKKMLDHGASVDARTHHYTTPLMLSSIHGPVEFVELLLAYGAEIDAADKDGQTALHQATSLQKVEIMAALVENGANVNAKDTYGFTPLHHAAETGRVSKVRYLMDNGANPQAKLIQEHTKFPKDSTPRDVAEKAGQNNAVRMIDKLIELGKKYPNPPSPKGT